MLIKLYGRDLQKLSISKRRQLIKNAFSFWRDQGFPYPSYTTQEIEKEFNKFLNSVTRFNFKGSLIGNSTVGLNLANSFHPQMWDVPSQGHHRSPIDHFNNDETLEKLLERAINFWPNRQCWSPYSIRNIFRVYAGGRVSNFRPTAASFIINRFSKKEDRVLDFCAGFGGRLLGSLALDRHYLGIDPSTTQIKGLKKMYSSLKKYSPCQVNLITGTAEDIMPTLKSKSFDLIFTSPPYFDLEKYGKGLNQSFLKHNTYSGWKEHFLETVIKESHRLLKPTGKLVINIANTCDYPISDDFKVAARSYFKPAGQLEMLMNARPLQRVNGLVYRSEPIYIYKKK